MRFHWLHPRLTKKTTRSRSFRPRLERLEDKLAPAVFMVTNTNDGGPGSLDEAIFQAENTPNATVDDPDEIHFNIDGAGVHTIHPSQSLPIIADPVIIDGYTQPGASPNTLAVGDNAVILIEIDCSATSQRPFHVGGDGSTVRGLCINHCNGFAFTIGDGLIGNHITIAGNFMGTDPTGMIYEAGLGSNGIFLSDGVGETIGGPTPADRNVIVSRSSTQTPMITFAGSVTQDDTIQGNYIGINAAGTAALNGGFTTTGMFANGNSGHTIENNVIVANNFAIGLDGSNIIIRNNLIGTNAAGTEGLGGGVGILMNEAGAAEANNTISGNLISGGTSGISIQNTSGGISIRGNKIGTDITGTAPIPNSGPGIFAFGPVGAVIGGTGPGEGNIIAFNGGAGVLLSFGAIGYAVSGNSIFSNGGPGIDLSFSGNPPDGVTLNDSRGHTGPNNFQNFPVLTSAVAASNTTIIGTLNSTPNTTFQIEFFASDAADPTGFGEGQTFLGFTSVTTDANGDASFSVTLPAAVGAGQVVTATATDPAGNTSEFSVATVITVGANTPPVITDFSGPATIRMNGSGLYTVAFTDPDPDTWTGTIDLGDGRSGNLFFNQGSFLIPLVGGYASPGTYTLTVTIADNHGGSDSRSLNVTVIDNTPPVAVADAAALATGTSRTINVLANDSDLDGDTLTLAAVTQPASGHGTVAINADGTLTYTQTVFVNGTESFTYSISDGHGGTATAMVTVTVNLTARVGIDMLRDQVNNSTLGHGQKTSLIAKLDAAQRALAKGHTGAAIQKLVALRQETRAFKHAHILRPDLADAWLLEAKNIVVEIRRGN